MKAQNSFDGRVVHTGAVLPEWIDYNGHMNVAYYVLAFDLGIDGLWGEFGITAEHIKQRQSSTFAVENHVHYKQELKEDDPYVITSQILAYDEKRIHQFQRMYHAQEGFLAATAEWMSLHIDLQARRVAPWPADILNGIQRVAAAQPDAPQPQEQGSTMAVRKPLWQAHTGAS
ncbi:MAG: thioesterase family protein [Woeseiaceae bacterium]